MCGGCGSDRFRGQSVPPLCSATSGCSCVRSSMRFLTLWLQIALEWLHDCCHLVWCCHVRRCMRGSRVATSCCKTHCNGCMNVAWALFWGGSRSTQPCIFPCKVGAAGDERYLVCAAVAVWIVWRSIGSSSVFCNEWLFLCV